MKVIKRIIRKSHNPYLALLKYRNIPPAAMSNSPAERMLGLPTRSILPICHNNKTISNKFVLQEKLHKSPAGYKKSVEDPNPLAPVPLRKFSAATDRHNKWMTGKVLERLSDRSYAVLNEETGNIIRRNRVDIKNCFHNDSNEHTDLSAPHYPSQSFKPTTS